MPHEQTLNGADALIVRLMNLVEGTGITITVEKGEDGVVNVTISQSGE